MVRRHLTRLVMHDGRPLARTEGAAHPDSTDTQEHPVTDQTADLREQYAHAIRNRVRIRFGPTVLRLARQGRPIKLTTEEAEAAADAVLAIQDAARQAAGQPAAPEGFTWTFPPGPNALRCPVEFISGGYCTKPFGHRPPGSDDPHTPEPAVEQPAEAQPAEAHPPREGWRIELLDVDGWMPSGLVRPDRDLVAQYLAGRRKQRPDATFRLVRETTTWTVEETR